MTNCLREVFLRLSSDTSTYSVENKISFIPQGGTNGRNQEICNIEVLYQPSSKVNRISRDLAEERLGYKIDGTSATKDITLVWYYHSEYKCKYKSKFRVSSERNLDVVFGLNDTFVYDGSSVINAGDTKSNPFRDALRDGHLKKRRSSWKKILLNPGGTTSSQTASRPQRSSTRVGGPSQHGLEDTVASSLWEKSLSQYPVQAEASFPDLEIHASHLLREIPQTSSHLAKVSTEDPQSGVNNAEVATTTAAVDLPNESRLSAAPQCESSSATQDLMKEVPQGQLERSFAPSIDTLSGKSPVAESSGVSTRSRSPAKSPGVLTARSRSLADSNSGALAELHNQSPTQAFRAVPGSCVSSEPTFGLNTGDRHQLPDPDGETSHVDISSVSMSHFPQGQAIPTRNESPVESSWQTTAMDVGEGKLMKSFDSDRHIQTTRQADEISQRSGPSDNLRGILHALRGKALEHPDQYWHWDERVQKYYHFDDGSEFPIWYELLD